MRGKIQKTNLPKIDNRVAVVVLVVLVSLSAGFFGGYFGSKSAGRSSSIDHQASRQVIESEGNLISQLAKDVSPSVVSINVVSEGAQQTFFGTRRVQQQSAGSGVIIDDKGTIITNRHVIPKSAKSLSVTLSDGTELKDVEVVGRTNDSDSLDVAFIKIKDKKGKDLKPAKLGDSSKVQVGDRVIAIGYALGEFENTVTSGIISGYGRNIQAEDGSGEGENLQNLFQTDASINQGNSGGPLVNSKGEVIAINTAVAGSAENIGFAIPIGDIQGLITGVLKNGKIQRPYIGVRYVSLSEDYAYRYNLDVKKGAYLAPPDEGEDSPIIKDSPADKAGLKEKDIITKVDGKEIDDKTSMSSLISRKAVGDEVKLTVIRDGKKFDISVKLESLPEN